MVLKKLRNVPGGTDSISRISFTLQGFRCNKQLGQGEFVESRFSSAFNLMRRNHAVFSMREKTSELVFFSIRSHTKMIPS